MCDVRYIEPTLDHITKTQKDLILFGNMMYNEGPVFDITHAIDLVGQVSHRNIDLYTKLTRFNLVTNHIHIQAVREAS